VRGINLQVSSGEICGLLGPNGAGKTTLIKMISTLIIPTSGTLEVCGFDVATQDQMVRQNIGVVLANRRSLYWKLTAVENIQFFGALYGLSPREIRERGRECLNLAGLSERANDRVETFSTGMQQRLQIALGLLHRPKLLILDEPTSALDPLAAEKLRDSLRALNLQGLTVLLATHNLDEADRICDRVVIVNRCQIRAEGSPRDLRAGFGQRFVELVVAGDQAGLEQLPSLFCARPRLHVKPLGEAAVALSFAAAESPDEVLDQVRGTLVEFGLRLTRFNEREPNLGDVFLNVTSEEFR
jgi:ABC-2 type transport system ATP-binding protein